MARVFIFAFFLFYHLPILNSAEERNNSKPFCPKSFKCKDLGEFKFPFYNNSMDPRCGLCKLTCNETVPKLQLGEGGRLYDVKSALGRHTIVIHDQEFQRLLDKQDCDSLKNLSLPNSPSISFKLAENITLFKCPKTSQPTQRDKLFHDYYSSKECKQHNLYYKYPNYNLSIPINLPENCSIIQLPLLPGYSNLPDHNASQLFKLLSADFVLHIEVCWKCFKEKGTAEKGTAEKGTAEKGTLKLILATAIPGAIFVLIIFLIIFTIWVQKKWSILSSYCLPRIPSSEIEDGIHFGVPVFSYKDLEEATHKFDPSQELGDGGFGTVYYGKLRDGREVAVKRLYENNYKRVEQFMNEIEILTLLRHKNLVQLYGSTSHRSRDLLLVYEYIPNGTVADHLHGNKSRTEPLTWPVRMNIAMETASALSYLHKSDIIHRDVKTNNILLDKNFCVKVADFGLSRLFPTDVTHVSTAPQGTPGYVDPEYHLCYQLTDKSDVYSFGVVLIELISSMPAVDRNRGRNEINLANLAINKIQRYEFSELIDRSLGYESDTGIERMTTSVAELAFRCLQLDKDLRPTMDEVLGCLKEIQGGDVSESGMPFPSPESENVVLLKDSKLVDSPVGITDKWMSSRSTASTSGGECVSGADLSGEGRALALP